MLDVLMLPTYPSCPNRVVCVTGSALQSFSEAPTELIFPDPRKLVLPCWDSKLPKLLSMPFIAF